MVLCSGYMWFYEWSWRLTEEIEFDRPKSKNGEHFKHLPSKPMRTLRNMQKIMHIVSFFVFNFECLGLARALVIFKPAVSLENLVSWPLHSTSSILFHGLCILPVVFYLDVYRCLIVYWAYSSLKSTYIPGAPKGCRWKDFRYIKSQQPLQGSWYILHHPTCVPSQVLPYRGYWEEGCHARGSRGERPGSAGLWCQTSLSSRVLEG